MRKFVGAGKGKIVRASLCVKKRKSSTRKKRCREKTQVFSTTERARVEGMSIKTVLAKLLVAVEAYDVGVIVAHNVSFDFAVVGAELARAGNKVGLKMWSSLGRFCTLEATRSSRGYRRSLANAYQLFCGPLPAEKLHTAADDTRLCARLLEAVMFC